MPVIQANSNPFAPATTSNEVDGYSPSNIEAEAISQIVKEVTTWENGVVFVTPKVSYQMREVIKKCRKNYWGVFEIPFDEATGREKIWYPLTETMVENTVKNIDIDSKDINLKAKMPYSTQSANVSRYILRDKLKKLGLGELLDEIERSLCVDGTVVLKSWKGKDRDGKATLQARVVDLLNFYIDPQAYSIQEAPAVIERVVLTIDEFNALPDLINKDKVGGSIQVNNVRDIFNNNAANPLEVELWIREGLMSKYFMTGEEADRNKLVDGYIVMSGLTNGAQVIHKIKLMDSKWKSYEEAWLTRVNGRWGGRGIAEKLFSLQAYLNEVINMRINSNRISQIGLFKARKGSGVTGKAMQNLVAGGVITVKDLSDIEQFDMRNPAMQDSLNDEENTVTWAQKVTQNPEVSQGDNLPSSMPATNAAIANQNSKSAFALIQEGLGMFLQRVISRHWLPILKATTTAEDIVRVTGEASDLAALDQSIMTNLLNRSIGEYFMDNGEMPDQMQVQKEIGKAKEKMQKLGKDRYIKSECFMSDEYDVDVYVTNEDFDKNTILQNLQQLIFNVAKASPNVDIDGLITEYLDVMGLSGSRFFKAPNPMMAQGQTKVSGQPQEGQDQNTQPGNALAANATPASPGQLISNSTKGAMQGAL